MKALKQGRDRALPLAPRKSKGSLSELQTVTWRARLHLSCLEGSGVEAGTAEAVISSLQESGPEGEGGAYREPRGGLREGLCTAVLHGPRQDAGEESGAEE